MAAFLLMICKHICSYEEKINRFTRLSIAFCAFALAMAEWTGYIFNIGLCTCLFIFNRKITKDFRILAIYIFTATIAAGFLTIFHYGLVLGFDSTLKAILSRGVARSISNGNIFDLLSGYLLSYGIFIFVSLVAAFQIHRNRNNLLIIRGSVIAFLFISSLVPLLENIMLLNHAVSYSFDRLKFIFPASLLMALGFYFSSKIFRVSFFIILVLSSVLGYMDYRSGMNQLSDWSLTDIKNTRLKDNIAKLADINCSLLATNLDVRGYANILFHRGIYEMKSIEDADFIFRKSKACSLIYLEGEWARPPYLFFPKYSKGYIKKPNGQLTIILAE
jgi:hypothetical protein